MKKFKNILFLAGLVAFFASCESDEEKYSGTPIGNQAIEVLHGEISVDDPTLTSVLTSQEIPFTVDIKRTFVDTVTVEVTTMNKSGGRTRTSVDVLPGDSTASEKILASGGAIFDSTMEMYISGIALKNAEIGKHYLIDSNKIVFNTGNTATPSDDINRLQVRVAWYNPSTTRNNLRVYVDRPGSYVQDLAPGATVFDNGSLVNPIIEVTLTSGDTSGLLVGSVVNVSSGAGAFKDYTTVLAITGPNKFRISKGVQLPLGPDTVITASGADLTLTGGSSSGTTVTVASTANLQVGMIVTVSTLTGNGRFRTDGTYVTEIIDGTKFKVNLSPSPAISNNATIIASFGDATPEPTGAAAISHSFRIAPGPITGGYSSQEGDYFIKLSPLNILSSGQDLRYRIVWKFPDGSTDFYDGTYQNLTLGSAPKTVLKVTKAGSGNTANFTVTEEGL